MKMENCFSHIIFLQGFFDIAKTKMILDVFYTSCQINVTSEYA